MTEIKEIQNRVSEVESLVKHGRMKTGHYLSLAQAVGDWVTDTVSERVGLKATVGGPHEDLWYLRYITGSKSFQENLVPSNHGRTEQVQLMKAVEVNNPRPCTTTLSIAMEKLSTSCVGNIKTPGLVVLNEEPWTQQTYRPFVELLRHGSLEKALSIRDILRCGFEAAFEFDRSFTVLNSEILQLLRLLKEDGPKLSRKNLFLGQGFVTYLILKLGEKGAPLPECVNGTFRFGKKGAWSSMLNESFRALESEKTLRIVKAPYDWVDAVRDVGAYKVFLDGEWTTNFERELSTTTSKDVGCQRFIDFSRRFVPSLVDEIRDHRDFAQKLRSVMVKPELIDYQQESQVREYLGRSSRDMKQTTLETALEFRSGGA